MKYESGFERLISGQTGAWTTPIRGLLTALALPYSAAVRARNRKFDSPAAAFRSPLPVISVGNITAGGTGKTPLVIELVRRLEKMNARVAVLSRGYKSKSGKPNDEELLIRRYAPNVIYIADADRVRGARLAREKKADVLVLDDGFQHRRLARDLDLVCIDSTCPFGYDRVLPRGLLREPLTGLRRASAFVLTRSDQIDSSQLNEITLRLQSFAPSTPIIRSTHRITAVDYVNGTPVEGALNGSLRGKRAVVFAAIARPRAFVETVKSLGVEMVGSKWWPDHHQYWQKNIHDIVVPGRMPTFDVALTTEKDAVKLADVPGYDPAFVMVVKVAIDFSPPDGTILDQLLTQAMRRSSPN